jgi:hypothetical protein
MGNSHQDMKGKVAEATYRVDATAVAEAMLRHPGVRRLLGADRDGRFSRPAGAPSPAPGPSASRNG